MAPFGIELGIYMGSVIGAGGGLTYLLRTLFADATPATLTNGQVLDTPEEGVIDGDLTVVNAAAGVLSLVDNKLKVDGTGLFAQTGVYTSETVFQGSEGYLMLFKITSVSAGAYILAGLHDSAGLANGENDLLFGVYAAVALGKFKDNGGTPATWVVASNVEYEICIGLSTSGTYFYIKGGVFTDWCLIAIAAPLAEPGNLQLQNALGSAYFDGVRIPDALYPDLFLSESADDMTAAAGTLNGATLPKGGLTWTNVDAGTHAYDGLGKTTGYSGSHHPAVNTKGVAKIDFYTASSGQWGGLVLRYVNATNMFTASMAGGTNQAQIRQGQSTIVAFAGASTPTSTWVTLTARDDGNQMGMTIGGNSVTYNSTAFNTSLVKGFRNGNIGNFRNYEYWPGESSAYNEVLDNV